MPAHPNVKRISDAYAAFAEADLGGALKDLAPDALFHFNGSGPLSGDHTGIDEISKALIGTFELTGGTQRLDIASVYADDHHAVVIVRETASRPDGATLDVDEVHILAFDGDGKITDL
ncbi:MAG TPA: nuclear transport factor 2 family protein [Acidimicrobiales bacterium]|nr:nuclear transport factor 2 family protein [Acidimicrobiales bacterium]